jgi:hypothetical protein
MTMGERAGEMCIMAVDADVDWILRKEARMDMMLCVGWVDVCVDGKVRKG